MQMAIVKQHEATARQTNYGMEVVLQPLYHYPAWPSGEMLIHPDSVEFRLPPLQCWAPDMTKLGARHEPYLDVEFLERLDHAAGSRCAANGDGL